MATGQSTKIAYRRLEDVTRPVERAELEKWRQSVTDRLNRLLDMFSSQVGSFSASGATLWYKAFVGDGTTQDFVLDAKVVTGATPIVSVGTIQRSIQFAVQSYSTTQDKIHLNFVPESGEPVVVFYPPA
jgi:hypothetical protein